MTDTTRSLLAAQKYVEQFMTLDKSGFRNSLAEDASGLHSRMQNGFQVSKLEVKGKEELYNSYVEYFFSCTDNFNLKKVSYKGFELHAKIKYEAEESKKEEGNWVRYRFNCKTQLDFKKEGESLKIVNIWERTAKELLPS